MDASTLGFGATFASLATRDGLIALDKRFLQEVAAQDPALHERLLTARAAPDALDRLAESHLITSLGPILDGFVAELFGIEDALDAVVARTKRLDPVHACKRLFVQRQAVKKYADPAGFDGAALRAELEQMMGEALTEIAFATHVEAWERNQRTEWLDTALRYAAWATLTSEGRAFHAGGTLFGVPHKVDPQNLVPLKTVERHGVTMHCLPQQEWRARDGFALTDHGMTGTQALDQMNYCIWCHTQGKDSCSKGLKDRKTGAFQKSVFGVTLAGCPLEEKISEMHTLRAQGSVLGAFATIAVDNPMMAATGHRICNDCMKACIYQKQDAVDIPQAETSILKDVLSLPWGFEIYALLTRWNPLDIRRPLPLPDSGRKVLVVGLGPAGFTLAHHLMNDGHTVVAIDGLKLEPLGIDPNAPVRDAATLFENLDDRVMAGFGGVAEYGITVRWNKNYLKLIRILLERRAQFAAFGGVRFGGGATLSIDDAWTMGFDHVALCMGAGRPTVIDMPNGLARGVRQASDFLMGLQLTGAAKMSSIANLQIRMPVVVIGGGLTAVDTATESLAYYVRQVEKFATRYGVLVAERGEQAVRAAWTEEETGVAEEFLAHAAALRAEREAAAAEGRAPRFAPLLDSWGGATVAYRRKLTDSPSYTLNHEEVAHALAEGVHFAAGLAPLAVEVDRFGHAAALRCTRADGTEVVLPARAVLVAAGTQPNTVLAREDGRIRLDGKYFQAVDEAGNPVTPVRSLAKPDDNHILMHRTEEGRFISFFGDLHPSFFGNVVKAMGSAKRGYPLVSQVLAGRDPASSLSGAELIAQCRDTLQASVHAVNRLTPNIVEVVLRAPAASRSFRPGQFYRLQNYEMASQRLEEPGLPPTLLTMEGLAMTGAWTDKDRGLISVIALEMGGSSDLCATLQPGQNVVLMGPTGTPTEIHANSTVALVGGGLGNAVLFSIGAALRAAGSRVIYFAGYKAMRDRYKIEEIERAADVIVWCCDEAPGFTPARPQDRSFVGNIVQAMAAYGAGRLGEQAVPLNEAEHLIVIGSDRMMQAVGVARKGVLQPYLKPGHTAIGSINSPMQCMMKEVCAQCLQPQIDPETGERTVIFSCFNQDQPLDRVDFPALNERLRQNSLPEKLTKLWIDRALRKLNARPALAAE
ncbi:Pyridine nucleotide-disulfide oxidoreductase [Rhodovastum atsumiense]|uniref:Pyridine nucleotide-disulfide oxidoreductase n=1 Tax=Rhodovastum atsumiense TaxID=504468 RepID=A0A5M6IUT3_9PROT|nr:FAD-dependent oxidoreductase [Rhodovastum atsumiense]KAA5612046.1 pyridine nucleotide-disulfide oxidoreductase [Rhodovastum atsumiense]CAH2604088.1 Pyridine nucleotide-disulfide oxidoreductase [Rhodovastum atsumiense]